MEAGCYVLHLYCDRRGDKYPDGLHDYREYEAFPHEYASHQLGSKARRAARRDGWKFKRDGTHLCPKCAKVTP